MTTFDIDNTCKTKYLEVLESIKEQAHALKAIHNPQTWRLSALTFALHLHDCYILFDSLKKSWAVKIPLSEAWDVNLSGWKNEIWSLVNDVSSFTENDKYANFQHLCEEDYRTFIKKTGECLGGTLPINDILDFLSEKNTELKNVIIDSGKDLSTLLSDTQAMLYNLPSLLYEKFYDDLVGIYLKDNDTPYMIAVNDGLMPYEQWKASKSQKKLPELISSKIKNAHASMLDIKFWQETWEECFDLEKREINKEGFARFIFQNRKSIIGNKQYPCKNCLEKCFATLCLCEHLWNEYDRLKNPEVTVDVLKQKILPDIKPLEEIVKDEYKQRYLLVWNLILEDDTIFRLLKEINPNKFKGGYNQKLVCNIIGMMAEKGLFTKSKNKIDALIYLGTTHYKYLTELAVNDDNKNCAMTENVRNVIENILDNSS